MGPTPPLSLMMLLQFWGWEVQRAVRAVREYVYVNSPFNSSRTYSVWITSLKFPSCHLGHRHRVWLQGRHGSPVSGGHSGGAGEAAEQSEGPPGLTRLTLHSEIG